MLGVGVLQSGVQDHKIADDANILQLPCDGGVRVPAVGGSVVSYQGIRGSSNDLELQGERAPHQGNVFRLVEQTEERFEGHRPVAVRRDLAEVRVAAPLAPELIVVPS